MVATGCSQRPFKPSTGALEPAGYGGEIRQATAKAALRCWQIKGKASIMPQATEKSRRISLSVIWQQQTDQFEVTLSGPLGQGKWQVFGGALQPIILTDGVEQLSGADAELFMMRELGWILPFEAMSWWMRGLPAPLTEATTSKDRLQKAALYRLNNRGLIAQLEQQGWLIEYTQYQNSDPMELPRKIRATHPRAQVKVSLNQWSLNTEPCGP